MEHFLGLVCMTLNLPAWPRSFACVYDCWKPDLYILTTGDNVRSNNVKSSRALDVTSVCRPVVHMLKFNFTQSRETFVSLSSTWGFQSSTGLSPQSISAFNRFGKESFPVTLPVVAASHAVQKAKRVQPNHKQRVHIHWLGHQSRRGKMKQ